MAKKILEKILNPGEEIKYQFSLGERYLKITKIITIVIGALILLLIGVFILPIFKIDIMIIVLIIGACLGLLVGFSFLYFGWYLKRANIYIITNKRVIVHRGLFSTRLITVTFREITDLKVIQSFADRIIYRTGILKINTAGMEAHPIVLSHIENPYMLRKKISELRDSSFDLSK